MKQIINYQDNLFCIQNSVTLIEEAMHMELYPEFSARILESLIESVHASFLTIYKHLDNNTQLKDQIELQRLCAQAGDMFAAALDQLQREQTAVLQAFTRLSADTVNQASIWHREKATAVMNALSASGPESGDSVHGLSSDELSGLLDS